MMKYRRMGILTLPHFVVWAFPVVVWPVSVVCSGICSNPMRSIAGCSA